jgi:arylsulfatase A-like enzyme
MMMSGQTYLHFEEDARDCRRKGIKRRHPMYANPLEPTFPKSMKLAGYETFFREKSGSANNPDIRKQFDHYKDIHMVTALRTGRPAKGIVDDAIDFVGTRKNDKPFFMYLGFPCPHDPRWATARFRDMYDPSKLPLPPDYKPVHPYDIGDMAIRDECLEVWPRTKAAVRRHHHDYYALISSMDYDIGRLLDALDKLELNKNTLIIFSSDQGVALGSQGLMGKQNIYDCTMRVPLMISGPGIDKGQSDALVYIHDIYPTVCDLVGTEIPNVDGKSILPILRGDQKKVRDNLVLAYKKTQRSIRDDRWKLIVFPKINTSLFFDLRKDYYEMNNLINTPEHQDRIKQFRMLLAKELKALGDTTPLDSDMPAEARFTPPKTWKKPPYPAGGLAPTPLDEN